MVHILGAFLYPLEDGLNFLLGIELVILRLTGFAILSYQMTPGPSGVDAYQSGIGNPISISRDHHNLPRSQVHIHGRRVYTPGSDCHGEIGGEVP